MAGNTKALRARIKSVTSTQQLTSAMGLVASSKIRKATLGMLRAREYIRAIEQTIANLCLDPDVQKSPYMARREGKKTKLIVIAGDRGLAGGYNANVFRLCGEIKGAEIFPIGKRACDRFGAAPLSSEHFDFETAYSLAETLCQEFLEGVYDRIGVVYTDYVSVMSSSPAVKWLLPLNPTESGTVSAIYEPDRETVLQNAVKEYVAGMILALTRESFACEVAARRNAMDSAEKNAKEMLEKLSLEYNRARQGAITQEITEIVAGSGENMR